MPRIAKILNPYLLYLLKVCVTYRVKHSYTEKLNQNDLSIIAEYTKLSKRTIERVFSESEENKASFDYFTLSQLCKYFDEKKYPDWHEFQKIETNSFSLSLPVVPFNKLTEEYQHLIEIKAIERINEINKINVQVVQPENKEIKLKSKIYLFSIFILAILIIAGILLKSHKTQCHVSIHPISKYTLYTKNRSPKFFYIIDSNSLPIIIETFGIGNFKNGKFNIDTIKNTKGDYTVYLDKPGSYKLKISKNSQLIKVVDFYSFTDDWIAWAKFVDHHTEEKSKPITNTKLFTVNSIMKFPEQPYRLLYSEFAFVKDFSIPFDSFIVESRLRNNDEFARENDTRIWLWANHGYKLAANFLNLGAGFYSYLYLGDTLQYQAKTHTELSQFAIDLSDWRIIKIVVIAKKAKFFVDNVQVGFDYEITKPLTKFYGLYFTFKGRGEIDWVKISRTNGKLVYFNHFM